MTGQPARSPLPRSAQPHAAEPDVHHITVQRRRRTILGEQRDLPSVLATLVKCFAGPAPAMTEIRLGTPVRVVRIEAVDLHLGPKLSDARLTIMGAGLGPRRWWSLTRQQRSTPTTPRMPAGCAVDRNAATLPDAWSPAAFVLITAAGAARLASCCADTRRHLGTTARHETPGSLRKQFAKPGFVGLVIHPQARASPAGASAERTGPSGALGANLRGTSGRARRRRSGTRWCCSRVDDYCRVDRWLIEGPAAAIRDAFALSEG